MEEVIKRYDKWDVFLWSGRRSCYNAALPYAPRSYAGGCIETLRNACVLAASYEYGDRRFALTNHGLEIWVLVLEVDVEEISEELSESRCISFKEDRFRVKVRHIGPKPCKRNWAIGVLDYAVDGKDGYIDRFREYSAFLLSSNKDSSIDLPATAKWKKETTKEVVRIHKSSDHVQKPLSLLYL
jgi:hypothetical protein